MKDSFFKRIVRHLYPDRCPVCDLVLFDTRICPECVRKLTEAAEPVCMRCGKPLGQREREYCGDCSRKEHLYDQGKAVWVYQGAMPGILYRYKYGNRRDYTEFLAGEAARRYSSWIAGRGIDLIVPVPLHKKRQRQRGYNQAELLAKELGREMGLPVCADCLIRTKHTVPQKSLSDEERKNNLKNAFKIHQNVVKWKRILLVDDIYTTGSTVDAAAQILREAGADRVYVLCVSIGRGQ